MRTKFPKQVEVLVIHIKTHSSPFLQKKSLLNHILERIWRKTEMWSTVCCQIFCKNKINYRIKIRGIVKEVWLYIVSSCIVLYCFMINQLDDLHYINKLIRQLNMHPLVETGTRTGTGKSLNIYIYIIYIYIFK